MVIKLCKNCRYYGQQEGTYVGLDGGPLMVFSVPAKIVCEKAKEKHIDLVTGVMGIITNQDPYSIRYNESFCGQEGRWWEPVEGASIPVVGPEDIASRSAS